MNKSDSITIKDVSKKYSINQKQPYYALRDTLSKLFIRQKTSTFFALKNINLSIKQGEILGIIGKNGAGKSTLLKILSRITPPTSGQIILNGRVGSLLEVGTGFHPELTGRENIYLNGAILGMTRREIESKIKTIIDFSGIGKFIDTPVKRYSSGMYVRLAFSVAAHIEPEILLVDEVLSVGDAEFSEKSLDKLKEVSSDHQRTVIFVSHNLAAIRNLCTRVIWIDQGQIKADGNSDKVISKYISNLSKSVTSSGEIEHPNQQGTQELLVTHIQLENAKGGQIKELISGEDAVFKFVYKSKVNLSKVKIGFNITTDFGQKLIMDQSSYWKKMFDVKKGTGYISCKVKKFPLIEGQYFLSYRVEAGGREVDYPLDPVLKIKVINGDFFETGVIPINHSPVLVESSWNAN